MTNDFLKGGHESMLGNIEEKPMCDFGVSVAFLGSALGIETGTLSQHD